MRSYRDTMLFCLLGSLGLFLVVGSALYTGVPSVEAAGPQNLAFSDQEEAEAYQRFRERATVHGVSFDDLGSVQLVSKLDHKVWDVESNLYLEGTGMSILEAHVDEIPPGEHAVKHRGPNEAFKYVLSGEGYMLLEPAGEPEQRIEMKPGTLVAVPAYSWHYSYNTHATEPLRTMAVTPGPMIRKIATGRPADPENERYAGEAKERLRNRR